MKESNRQYGKAVEEKNRRDGKSSEREESSKRQSNEREDTSCQRSTTGVAIVSTKNPFNALVKLLAVRHASELVLRRHIGGNNKQSAALRLSQYPTPTFLRRRWIQNQRIGGVYGMADQIQSCFHGAWNDNK